MTDVDELLARLRKLPAIPLDREFEASLRMRALRRQRKRARRTPFAALLLAATVVSYLGWALHFTSELYR